MQPNLFFLASEVITKDGGLSIDYTFNIVLGICGFLIMTIFTIVAKNLNESIKKVGDRMDKFQEDFNEFVKKDFHEFISNQKVINDRFARYEEEQRDKDK